VLLVKLSDNSNALAFNFSLSLDFILLNHSVTRLIVHVNGLQLLPPERVFRKTSESRPTPYRPSGGRRLFRLVVEEYFLDLC